MYGQNEERDGRVVTLAEAIRHRNRQAAAMRAKTVCTVLRKADASPTCVDEIHEPRRMIKAIRNLNFDVIGHPSGRLIGHRQPSEFDLGEVLRVAHEEGCALEVNSQPDRLDLTDVACMAARQAGVKLVVSSDAHSPRDFELLDCGVNQARRGWVEAGDILNTHSLKSLRQR